jgi:hypothetical protein
MLLTFSNYRDGQQGEEQDGPLALGPVGLGILSPVFRHLNYFVVGERWMAD